MTRRGEARVLAGRTALRGVAGLVVLVLCARAVAAQDLLGAYRAAERHDATYQAARHAFAAALELIPRSRARLLPNVNLDGNGSVTRASAAFTGVPAVERPIHSWTWTLRLTQPVFDMADVYAYRESRFAVAQAQARFDAARSALILRVARAYFGVLAQQEVVSAARARSTAAKAQRDRARKGYRLGIAAVTDVAEAEARLELARAQQVAAANDLEDRRSVFERLTGVWPRTLAQLPPGTVIPKPLPDDMSAWIDEARLHNATVREAVAALGEAAATVRQVRAGYLPTLDFTASYGENYASDNLTSPQDYATRYRSTEVGLRLRVPIYSGGATDAGVARADEQKEEAAARLARARRRAGAAARTAFAGIESGLMQVTALRASLRAGQSAITGNEIGYRLGIRINSDVLRAEEERYVAQRDLAKARYGTLLQGLKLKAAAGALTVADLATLNALLGPQPLTPPATAGARALLGP